MGVGWTCTGKGKEKSRNADILFLQRKETRDTGDRTRCKYAEVTKELKIGADCNNRRGRSTKVRKMLFCHSRKSADNV